MLVDPYHQLKSDLYSTNSDMLICTSADARLPYRFIIWRQAISYDDAIARVDANGVPGKSYRIRRNPSVGGLALVSVIDTDDADIAKTVASDLYGFRYRLITPEEALEEDAFMRSLFPWRVMCRKRPPTRAAFQHLLDGDEGVILHTGYRPDCPRWAPDRSWMGTVYAIHVRDFTTAHLIHLAIGDCTLE